MYEEMDKSKRILVTGAAGFIGYHLSKRLLDEGAYVCGFDSINRYYDLRLKVDRLGKLETYTNFTFERGNLEEKDQVENIFTSFKPNIVINLAGQAGVRYSIEKPRLFVDTNINGFFNVLEACKKHEVKQLIYASSSSVYGNQEKVPFSESDNVDHPISIYAASKKANELMAYTYSSLYGMQITGLRFFTVYGPHGRPDMAYYSFTQKILNGEVIQVYNNGDLYRDFTYIDDIVEGIRRIMGKPTARDADGVPHKIYNIGNNKPVKLMYFIEVLEKLLGFEARTEFHPMQKGDVYQTYADITEIERDFGFCPQTSIEEGLSKFVDWYKEYYKV